MDGSKIYFRYTSRNVFRDERFRFAFVIKKQIRRFGRPHFRFVSSGVPLNRRCSSSEVFRKDSAPKTPSVPYPKVTQPPSGRVFLGMFFPPALNFPSAPRVSENGRVYAIVAGDGFPAQRRRRTFSRAIFFSTMPGTRSSYLHGPQCSYILRFRYYRHVRPAPFLPRFRPFPITRARATADRLVWTRRERERDGARANGERTTVGRVEDRRRGTTTTARFDELPRLTHGGRRLFRL